MSTWREFAEPYLRIAVNRTQDKNGDIKGDPARWIAQMSRCVGELDKLEARQPTVTFHNRQELLNNLANCAESLTTLLDSLRNSTTPLPDAHGKETKQI